MSDERVQDKVREIVADVVGADTAEIDADVEFADIPVWDSLKLIELVAALEQEFDVIFDANELEDLRSIPDVVRRLLN